MMGKVKENMRVKNLVTLVTAIFLFSMVFLTIAPAQSDVQPSDPAAFYKAKCVVCHGPKAEKKFDASLTDEQLVEAILKGKKPEKPPNMPAYGEKGVTAEHAKGLVEYMKQLKSAQ
jgi:mono/diheme cytochrome c family protein